MMLDKDQKRKTTIGNAESPGKARAKPKKKTDDEQARIANFIHSIRVGALNNPMPQPEETQPASSSSEAFSNRPKKTIHKQRYEQLAPSNIGIQSLYEAFEEANIKNKLIAEDYSTYMKLFKEWSSAKGKPQIKKVKLAEF